VLYYKGTAPQPVAKQAWGTLDAGTNLAFPRYPLTIGSNEDSGTQPADAMLDNMRVHIGRGASGALSVSALEAIRTNDLANVVPPQRARLTGISVGTNVQVRWRSVDGYTYTVESADSPFSSWSNAPGGMSTGNGTTNVYVEPTSRASALYRVNSAY
jgi:hypothetical protein